jgi:hypothetical protein
VVEQSCFSGAEKTGEYADWNDFSLAHKRKRQSRDHAIAHQTSEI